MVPSDRGKALVLDANRDDARSVRACDAQCEMDQFLVGPQAEQIAGAFAQCLADGGPDLLVNLIARPRPMAASLSMVFPAYLSPAWAMVTKPLPTR